MTKIRPLFPLGEVVATPGAMEAVSEMADPAGTAARIITRHVCGDWGDLDREDRAANDRAVNDGTRILSAYNLPGGTRIWIITEADRSVTTLLLPEEY